MVRKCSGRSKKDRGDASIFMSRILMATFSALVNQPPILNEANLNRPRRYVAQAGALAQFADPGWREGSESLDVASCRESWIKNTERSTRPNPSIAQGRQLWATQPTGLGRIAEESPGFCRDSRLRAIILGPTVLAVVGRLSNRCRCLGRCPFLGRCLEHRLTDRLLPYGWSHYLQPPRVLPHAARA